MIGYAEVVLVSTSCSRCSLLMFSLYSMTHWPHGLVMVLLCTPYIYSIDTILYPYTLPLEFIP